MSRNRTRMALSERDIAVLRWVQRFRLLSVDQVQRLTITTGSPATRARRTRSVLHRLSDAGYLRQLDRRIGGVHAGSSGTIYRITGRGIGVLARIDGIDRRRVGGEPGERYIRHVLAIGEHAVRVYELAATLTANGTGKGGGVAVDEYTPEPGCWRRYPAAHGGTAVLKPDAFVHAHDDAYSYVSYLEHDEATESIPTVLGKCRTYLDYWRSGLDQARYGVFPRVIWAVPDDRRADRIQTALHRLPPDARDLFAVHAGDVAGVLLGRDHPQLTTTQEVSS